MKTTTERTHVREIDPSTGHQVWVYRDVVKYSLNDEDRMQLVSEILSGKSTPEQVQKRYNIVSVNSVYTWIGKHVSQLKLSSLPEESDDDMANKSKEDQIKELKAALKQAQKKAELAELRADAYNKMITLAEDAFNIPIRKKSGTKQ